VSIHLRLASVGLVVLAATLAGCGDVTAQVSGTPTDPVAGEYVGDGPARLFPDGSAPIRLTLRDGEISFTGSCNHFSGQATWDDGVLRTSALGGTEMGCPGTRQKQDEWMVHFFASSPRVELDGRELVVRSLHFRQATSPGDSHPTPSRASAPSTALDLPVETVVHP
jgi:heat shock protein HslJ